MAWKIIKKEHQTHPRNTIKRTIIQLRFHPILKIGVKIPDFQDMVRERFPGFEEAMVRRINPISMEEIELKEERQFRFIKLDGQAVMGLGPTAIHLESFAHKSRAELFEDMSLAMQALEKTYLPIIPTRIGVRYINEIDKSEIGRDLHEPVEWEHIINSDYLRGPNCLGDLSETLMSAEIRSKVNGGLLTLRFGLIGDLNNPKFNIDIDRYFEGQFALNSLPEKLMSFADDIYSLYRSVVGPKLLKWLQKPKGD